MGCASSRESSSETEEERLIVAHEADLGFFKHTAQALEAQIKRETANGILTVPKLQRLMTSLHIDLDFNKPSSGVMQFFDKLKANGVISTNKLVVASILLGSGSLQKRAQLLFEHADIEAKGSLERNEVSYLFEEILMVCVDCLPVLAYSEKHEETLRIYQQRLSNNTKTQWQLAITSLMQSDVSVSQAHFISCLCKADMKYWLTPSDLRKALIRSHDDVLSSMNRAYEIKPGEKGESGKALFFKKPLPKANESQSKSPDATEATQESKGDHVSSLDTKATVPLKPTEEHAEPKEVDSQGQPIQPLSAEGT